MSYEPFHQKYRPRTFSDVVGQEAVAKTLRNGLRDGRVANAFLFAGSRGVGKTSMARILAKALNCSESQDGEPCGTCDICVSIAGGNDIDVIEVDGASNRGIDEIRTIRDNVGYAPSRSRFKVYIIDEVHMLTPQAFNALLKTLEEPPPHVKFVFATTEPQQVLETILSRCQRYEFRRISIDDIVGRLQWIAEREGIEVDRDVLDEIARKAEGGLRDSVSLLDQLVAFAGNQLRLEDLDRVLGRIDSQVLEDILEPAGRGDAGPLLDALDAAFESGRDAEDVLAQLTELFRAAMVREAQGLPGGGEGRRKDLVALVRQQFPLDRLMFSVRMCLNTRREIRLAGEGRLQLELCMLKISRSTDLISLGDIVKRLDGGAVPTAAPHPPRPVRRPSPKRKVPVVSEQASPEAEPPTRKVPVASEPSVSDAEPPTREVPVAAEPSVSEPEPPPRKEEVNPMPPGTSPVASGPPPVDVIRGEWGRVVEAVRELRPRAASMVRDAVPERVDGSDLTLRLPPGGDFKRRQLEGGLRLLVEDAIERVIGHRLHTTYVVPTVVEDQQRPRKTKVYEDPGVRRILDSFGGDVVDLDAHSGDT